MVTTQYFTTKPSKYVSAAMGVWFSRYWWGVALPLGSCALYGLSDWRYLIVALTLALVVVPGLVMLIYFNYALRAEVALAVLPHKISFCPGRIEIEYAPADDRPTPKKRTITSSEIASHEDTGQSLQITLKSGKYDIIEVPATAFKPGDFAKSLKIIEDLR